jgi:hypothetical protein
MMRKKMMRREIWILLIVAIASMCVVSRSAHGQVQTEIVPSISVSERYDTNVYFTSSRQHLSDYVTTIAPAINVRRQSRLIDLTGSIIATGNQYVRNPGLNYLSTTSSINLGLDDFMAQFIKRTALSVNDYFTYTPQPPAFYSPPSSGPGANDPANFTRGIQAVRANSLINVFGVTSSYIIDSATRIVGNVRHQYMRFGTAFAPTVGGGFFNTQYLTASAGPLFAVTAKDSISLNANYSAAYYAGSNFQLAGGTVGWERKLSRRLSFNVNAGVTEFLGGGRPLQYLGSGMLSWQERSTVTTLSVSRSVFPSFFVASTALVSNVVSLNVGHQFTEKLTGSVSGNYAKNESVSGPNLSFTTYSGSLNVNYLFTKRLTGTASYSHFVSNSSFAGTSFDFNRDVISLTVRYEWR